MILDGRHGLLEDAPPVDDFLALTSRRLIGLAREDGRERKVLLPVENVDAVEVTTVARNMKPLITGGLMILAAMAVAWLAAALRWEGVIPWLIAGILVVLGAIAISTYVVAEETATITFRTRAAEVSLPLRTPQALRDSYYLADAFFEAKAGHASAFAQRFRTGIPQAEAPERWPATTEPDQAAHQPDAQAASDSEEPSQVDYSAEQQAVADFHQIVTPPTPEAPPDPQQSAEAEGRQDV